MRKILLALGLFFLMLVCGLVAFVAAVWLLLSLGLRLHNNYEYYGQTPAVLLVYVAAAIGFIIPALATWYLYRRRGKAFSSQFSVRTLLIVVTIAAIALGMMSSLRF
jgi:hypothetical protein